MGKYTVRKSKELEENSMLHRRSLKHFILISLALMGMAVSSAHAISLNIDFGSHNASVAFSADYGAAANQIGHWNKIIKSEATDLLGLSGTSTGSNLSLSIDGLDIHLNGNGGGSANTDDFYLLNDSFFTNDKKQINKSAWSVTISNFVKESDQGIYDIYYYAPSHSTTATGAFSINDNVVDSLPGANSNDPKLIQETSWDVLRGVSIGEAGLLLKFEPGDKTNHYGLSGLQLVQTFSGPIDPISPIPVPAAFWLFGTALIGMIGFGKRRKAA
jgi:hypothetical protein